MAAAGTLTKLSTNPATSSFALVFSHYLLVVTEETATGPKEVGRFPHATQESGVERGFAAQKAGYGVDLVEVFARAK